MLVVLVVVTVVTIVMGDDDGVVAYDSHDDDVAEAAAGVVFSALLSLLDATVFVRPFGVDFASSRSWRLLKVCFLPPLRNY